MKKLACLLTGMLFSASVASAQVVTVDGVGVDRDSALRDASRAAVEQVAGTLIDSSTLTLNAAVELDEIYARSEGFVRSTEVVSEWTEGGAYCVRAKVDVDTAPNTELVSRLSMIAHLGDPRVGVVVLQSQDGYVSHDSLAESTLSEALLEEGFKHVLDPGIVAQLDSDEALWNIYTDSGQLAKKTGARPLDYLVIAKSEPSSYQLKLLGSDDGRVHPSDMLRTGRAMLTVKVLDYGTGTVLAAFHTEGQGLENSAELAERKAVMEAAEQAAEEMGKRFHRIAASTADGVRVEVTGSIESAEKLLDLLKTLPGVSAAYLRESHGGKTTIDIDSAQKPQTLIKLLRERADFPFMVDGMSASELRLSMP